MLWENRFFFKEFNFLLKEPKRVFLEIFYLKASIVWRVPETVVSSQHGFSFQDSRVNKLIQHICRLVSYQQSLITDGLLIWALLILLNSKGWNTNVVLESTVIAMTGQSVSWARVFRFYDKVKFLVFTSLRNWDFRCSCPIFQQTDNFSSKKEAGVGRAERGPRHGRRMMAANSQGPF